MGKKHTKEQNATLLVCLMTAFLSTFMGSALNLSIPGMGEHFDVSATLVGWVVTAYMLAVAAMSVPMGKIADTLGRRPLLVWGVFAFSVTGVLAAFSVNIAMMLAVRVAQGVAGSMIFSTNTAILISAFPPEERGSALGRLTASTYLGLSAGPVAGGILNHYLGWQSIFVTASVVGFIAFGAALRYLPRAEEKTRGGSLDVPGMALFVLMISLSLYGLTNLPQGPVSWAALLAGLLCAFLFGRRELAIDQPVVQLRVFRHNKAYTYANLAALLNYGANFAVGYLTSIYLQLILGLSSQTAGLVLVAQPVFMAFLSPYAGRLSDRIAPYKLASAGMALCAASLLMFAFMGIDGSLGLVFLALIVGGVGFALFSSPNTNAVMACVEPKDFGVASSILATMRSTGHSASMAVVTLIVGAYMGSAGLTEATPAQLASTMHTAFGLFTALCVAGIGLSMRRSTL
jgi:predicted MFS family arabinose efflux permease